MKPAFSVIALPAAQLRPWWLWPNLLSLDAPVVALVWQAAFARILAVELGWTQRGLLAVCVWLAYCGDRLLDARRLPAGPVDSARHAFARDHARPLAAAWCVGLALAAAMKNEGALIAADTDKRRLSQLGPRAERAGAQVAETVLLDPGREMEALAAWQGEADRVLVDAPCSGPGTWRRNPEARWRLSAAALSRLTPLTARLLDIAAQLVKPGGSITYVTCSLLDEEGAGQVAAFLADHPDWQADALELPLGAARGPGMRLTPSRDGTGGFFIARISKAS